MQIKLFIFLFLFSFPLHAHTFTGMIGFYDGISHPVLGLDHFLAMVCVGIISTQIGSRAIWLIPSIFVIMMIVGGASGMIIELSSSVYTNDTTPFISQVNLITEFGIVLSVILLGFSIVYETKLSFRIVILFVAIFGTFHGVAHGMEMPWAANPLLFSSGFTIGTAILHLFGVGIGSLAIKTKISLIGLKLTGVLIAIYGFYLLII